MEIEEEKFTRIEVIEYYFLYKWCKLVCFVVGHNYKEIDYFLGMKNNEEYQIIECDRCCKREII